MSFEMSSSIFKVLLKEEKSRVVSVWSEQGNMTYFHFKTKHLAIQFLSAYLSLSCIFPLYQTR